MKTRLLLIALLASLSVNGQTLLETEIAFESEDYFAVQRVFDGGASYDPIDYAYYLFDNGGKEVRLESLIIPEKKEILLALLNNKLTKYIKDFEKGLIDGFPVDDDHRNSIIKALNEIIIDSKDLSSLMIYNVEKENGKMEYMISFRSGHLPRVWWSADPYLTLNVEECKYFFNPDLFKGYD